VAAIPGGGSEAFVFENGTGTLFRLNYSDLRKAEVRVHPPLANPGGVLCMAADRAGVLYLPDARNHRVWKILPDGTASLFAGTGEPVYRPFAGEATKAGMNSPACTAVDPAGNVYIAETDFVRRVDQRGMISTFAGCSEPCSRGTQGTNRSIRPVALTTDHRGNVYVAETGKLWVLNPAGELVGIRQVQDPGRPGIRAPFSSFGALSGLAVTRRGEVLAADLQSHVIWRVGTNGFTSVAVGRAVIGSSSPGTETIRAAYSGNGPLTGFEHFASPHSLALDDSGRLLIADSGNSAVRLFAPEQSLTTVAGERLCCHGEEGTPATRAKFEWPRALTADRDGNIYVADPKMGRVRKIDRAGNITTVLGNGSLEFRSGVPALESGAQPTSVAVDSRGSIYVAEPGMGLVRRVTPNGFVESIAGERGGVFPLDILRWPTGGVAVGPDDSVYYLGACNVFRWRDGVTEPLLSGKCADTDGPLVTAAVQDPKLIAAGPDGVIYLGGLRKRFRAIRNGRLESLPEMFPIGTAGAPGGLWSGPDRLLYVTDYYEQGLPVPLYYYIAYALSGLLVRYPIASTYALPIIQQVGSFSTITGFDEMEAPFRLPSELQGITTDAEGRVLTGLLWPRVILVFPKVGGGN